MGQRTTWLAAALVATSACVVGQPDEGGGGVVDEVEILSLTSSSTTVDEQQQITLTVVADGTDVVFAWESTDGEFDDATAASVTWTAPLVSDTSHDPETVTRTLSVIVSNDDSEAEDELEITIANVNEVPTVDTAAAASEATPLPGSTVTLSIATSDAEGDALTYSWAQIAPATTTGVLSASDTATASWLAPIAIAATEVTFQVTVTDPMGGDLVQTATTTVRVPGWELDVLPLLAGGGCTVCHSGGTPSGMLAFDTADKDTAYAALVGITMAMGTCGGVAISYIEPFEPANSALFQKIHPGAGTCSGGQMPAAAGGTYFDDKPDQRTVIETWILAGALNN